MFFSTKKKRNFIHPKRTKLHFVGALSTVHPWIGCSKPVKANKEANINPVSKQKIYTINILSRRKKHSPESQRIATNHQAIHWYQTKGARQTPKTCRERAVNTVPQRISKSQTDQVRAVCNPLSTRNK
jgi:hypothetical protein